MKQIFILFVVIIVASCGNPKKSPAVEDKPLSRADMMLKIKEKERNEPEAVVMAKKPNNPGKGNGVKVTSGFINGGRTPIMGEASVSHGPTEDTLRMKVFHWGFSRVALTTEAIWFNVFISHTDANAPYPGRTVYDLMNYSEVGPNPNPAEWYILWPHDGLSVSYYFSVASDGGWNWGGKTIPNQ